MAGRRLLVVDDEPAVTVVIELAARLWNDTAATVRSLAEARAALADSPAPDLILLDVGLPDGSGLAFLAELRARPATATLPVIVLTGAGENAVLNEASTLGARVVSKPFSPAKLAVLVEELVPGTGADG